MKKLFISIVLLIVIVLSVCAEFDANQFADDFSAEIKKLTDYKCTVNKTTYAAPVLEVSTRDGAKVRIIISEKYLQVQYTNLYSNYLAYGAQFEGELSIGSASTSASASIIFPPNEAPMKAYVESLKNLIEGLIIPMSKLMSDFTFSL